MHGVASPRVEVRVNGARPTAVRGHDQKTRRGQPACVGRVFADIDHGSPVVQPIVAAAYVVGEGPDIQSEIVLCAMKNENVVKGLCRHLAEGRCDASTVVEGAKYL